MTGPDEVQARADFAKRVLAEVELLRQDEVAWAEYLEEAEATQVADDIDQSE